VSDTESIDDTAEGYVHEPSVEDDAERERRGTTDTGSSRAADREFGWRGWVLVGFLVVALVLVPGALYFLPRAQGVATSLGLSLRDAYLVLPLVPALVLGGLAVWATTRP